MSARGLLVLLLLLFLRDWEFTGTGLVCFEGINGGVFSVFLWAQRAIAASIGLCCLH